MGLSDFFTIQKNAIYGANGSVFIFAGIKSNVSEIKSMENVSIAWFEEAQAMSRESYDVLVPTIRAEGSILIFTFNPYKDNDPIYVEMQNADENSLVIKANYSDNPYFPEVLR
jgi:phage terminase large subunit